MLGAIFARHLYVIPVKLRHFCMHIVSSVQYYVADDSMSIARHIYSSLCQHVKAQSPTLSRSFGLPRRCYSPCERSWNQQFHTSKAHTTPLLQTSLVRRQWTYPRARQRFSTTTIAAHGHVTPPQPGEEYAPEVLPTRLQTLMFHSQTPRNFHRQRWRRALLRGLSR